MTTPAGQVPAARQGDETVNLDQRIREAETRLFMRSGLQPEESFVDLGSAQVRLRVLSVGAGPPLVMLHGVSLAAAVWAPWLADLTGYRALLVELPGHGLSGPVAYRPGAVRDHTLRLMDDLFDALGLDTAPVVGHSLGGMFALWYAAARPGRIASLVAIGDPAVALPGATVRMPLSLLTVPGLGEAVLRSPTPRRVYRRLLGQGLSPAAAAAAPDELLDVLRLAARRPGNARTVASLMHAIDGFRRPRADSIMTGRELGQITAPTMFCWGTGDPFLAPEQARPAIAKIPGAVLHEVQGGHGPWLEDSAGCARLTTGHFAATGFAPAVMPT
jgi:pimeloyl-ACP methyl ester carboxylesterase